MEPVEESALAGRDGMEYAMTSAATWTARAGVGALGLGLTLLGAPLAVADEVAAPADPPPPQAAVVDAVAATAPVEGVSHLPTPDSLPPGTTAAPTEGRKLGYIRDLWHAVRTQDVTMSDALLLFAQRPMDANAPLAAMSPHNDPVVIDGAVVPPPAAEAPVADTAAPATAP